MSGVLIRAMAVEEKKSSLRGKNQCVIKEQKSEVSGRGGGKLLEGQARLVVVVL